MKARGSGATKLLVLLPAAALLLWGLSQWWSAFTVDVYTDQLRADAVRTLGPEGPAVPRRVGVLTSVARLRESALFPPDYVGASSAIEKALPREPLRSGLWISLARYEIFRGDRAGARVALEFSDKLDPAYPRQRLEAVQIWGLLGERQQAADLARQVASLDFESAREAADALRSLGLSPADIYGIVSRETHSSRQTRELIRFLRVTDGARNEALIRAVDPVHFADAQTLNVALETLSRPLRLDAAVGLWRRHAAVPPMALQGVPDAWIADTSLRADPLENQGYFGWQRMPPAGAYRAEYRPNSGNQPAAVVASYSEEGSRTHSWLFYRVPLPPTPMAIAIRAEIEIQPEFSSSFAVSAKAGSQAVRKNVDARDPRQIHPVELVIPPSGEARLLELTLERARSVGGFAADGRLLIRNLQLVPVEQAGEAAAP